MIGVSKTDFRAILRFLDVLSVPRDTSIKEREIARRAALLKRKLRRKEEYDGRD